MKSIRQKLILCFALLLVVTSVANLAIGIYCAKKSINITVNDDLKSIGTVAEVAIVNTMEKYKATIRNIGDQDYLFDAELAEAQKIANLKEASEQNGYESLSFFDNSGNEISSDNSSHKTISKSDDDYKKAMSGEVIMTTTKLDTAGDRFVFLYCPTEYNNERGVLVAKLDCQTYSNIIKDITVNKSGNIFMLDGTGVSLANKNETIVAEGANRIEQAKTDKSLQTTAAVFSKMVAGETGIGRYFISGVERICYYMPIKNTDGWSVGVVAPIKEMTSSISFTILGLLMSSVVFLAIGIVIAVRVSGSISKPIFKMSRRLLALSEGDLSSDVEEVKSKDEIGVLNQSLIKTITILRSYISEISEVLKNISNGKLNVNIENEYIGEFAEIKVSLEKITSSLSTTMGEILASSDQVANGSDQVSSGAQALAQGATEQASSVEELSATISEISQQINRNAENTDLARTQSMAAGTQVKHSNDQMQEMIVAMNNINAKSVEISKIIKTIEDIAFQTNILALNAAVEAARAGSAGKGFAVVADEVRNLAQKSAEAAKNTTVLIEETVKAVGHGADIADNSAKSMLTVVQDSEKVIELINEIAKASAEQASAVAQVTTGIDQISAVVQTNSATAEESAAASEELSGQAQMLKLHMAKFELKKEDGGASASEDNYQAAEIQSDFVAGSAGKY